MRSFSQFGIACALALSCALAASAGQSGDSSQKPTTHKTHKTTAAKSRRKKSSRTRGQQKIDSERARSIQEALIREHYLTGSATGTWNQSSEDAMRKFQADHGWQSKTVPDSRALIALGLGPSKDHLLNPESAMTTGPEAPRAQSLPTTSHSPSPGDQPPASQPTDASQPQ
ncbi:MAG TPA: peptidoglycan-binding domain-containing protein [Candidatus Solibacter sp.]|nr:peptidoglycan-binding domain-containing protein [Candidatus Solibacter sp.]